MVPPFAVSVSDIEAAYERLRPVVTRTPLEHSARLSQIYEAEIYVKREDLQVVRSYKLRGAYNRMAALTDDERARGVVAASAGNHAQGVAFTCARLETRGRIYMPQNTPKQKINRVRRLGGEWVEIELTGDTYDASSREAVAFAEAAGRAFVHPFDDPQIIAGQGTVGMEIAEQLGGKAPDFLLVPIGGGGLISGLAVCGEKYYPGTNVVGVEPAGAASMKAALAAGRPVTLEQIDTFVDGAAVKTVGAQTVPICQRLVKEILTVPEGAICTEMIALYQSDGIIAEPAGALSIAALPQLGERRLRGKTAVCILSGGNNDITRYPEIIERSLIDQGLKHYFLIEFSQRPGALRRYLDEALGPDDDITLFEYMKKSNREFGPALVGIELTRREDYAPLLARMEALGLGYEVIRSDSALFRFVL